MRMLMRSRARERKKNFSFFHLCRMTEKPLFSLLFLYVHCTYRAQKVYYNRAIEKGKEKSPAQGEAR